jgi:thioredoxin-dependent peroxiredoxin
VIHEGRPAPDFELETDAGETVRLSDFRGRRVLYFYPKGDTRSTKCSNRNRPRLA